MGDEGAESTSGRASMIDLNFGAEKPVRLDSCERTSVNITNSYIEMRRSAWITACNPARSSAFSSALAVFSAGNARSTSGR